MSYRDLPNLHNDQQILQFKRCFALEKIHGTSARVYYSAEHGLRFSSGSASAESFRELFVEEELERQFLAIGHGHTQIVVYGEAHGGKLMRMSETYGKELRFTAYEVTVGGTWLAVPNAADVTRKLGLEFVHYEEGPCELEWLDAQRDAPSIQAVRCGIEEPRPREGIVIHPLREYRDSSGDRVIAKYKNAAFAESKNPRQVDPEEEVAKLKAQDAAAEFTVSMRLDHVLDRLSSAGLFDDNDGKPNQRHYAVVVPAMIADVKKEEEQNIEWSREVEKSIGRITAGLFKAHLKSQESD